MRVVQIKIFPIQRKFSKVSKPNGIKNSEDLGTKIIMLAEV